MSNKIWLVDFPLFQYNEDVKQLAHDNNLKIIDKMLSDSVNEGDIATKTPSISIKGNKAPSAPAKGKDKPKQAYKPTKADLLKEKINNSAIAGEFDTTNATVASMNKFIKDNKKAF